jgi:hypothetical protein
MTFQLSPQMKIVAIVGAVAVLALGGGMMFLGRGQATASAGNGDVSAAAIAALRKTHTKPALPVKHVAAAKHVVAAKARHAVTAKPKPVAPKPKPKAKPRPAIAPNGLPTPLADELELHDVVVVALFNPQSSTDSIAFQEARAGAGMANAGFLPVSVLDQRVIGPLTARLGHILPAPGLLIYRSPDLLVSQLDGFADRQTVAQAADNAAG